MVSSSDKMGLWIGVAAMVIGLVVALIVLLDKLRWRRCKQCGFAVSVEDIVYMTKTAIMSQTKDAIIYEWDRVENTCQKLIWTTCIEKVNCTNCNALAVETRELWSQHEPSGAPFAVQLCNKCDGRGRLVTAETLANVTIKAMAKDHIWESDRTSPCGTCDTRGWVKV